MWALCLIKQGFSPLGLIPLVPPVGGEVRIDAFAGNGVARQALIQF